MPTKLSSLRVRRGLRQAEVALATGILQGNYSRMERGGSIMAPTAEKIAGFFDVPLSALFRPDRYELIHEINGARNGRRKKVA